jgi:uncharacterized SAM-binding protein YcdF (DUF218 family)
MHLSAYLTELSHPELQGAMLVVFGLLCLGLRRYRVAAALGLLGMSWIILCATPAFAEWLRNGLVNPYPAHPPSEYPTADAIVVLGGGDPPDFGHGPGKEQANRTGFALELYRAARAPIILLSGGAGEAAEMAQALERQGVPASALRMEPDSVTTYQNAAYSAQVLNREHLHRILLVDSIVPMRRAAGCFEQQGLEVISAPIFDSYGEPVPGVRWRPQRTALFQSGRYLHEYLGMFFYQLRGWF